MVDVKTKLIHWLGGVTKEERNLLRLKAHCSGSRNAYKSILSYLQSLNGLPADEWCKKAYTYVDNIVKEISSYE